MGRGQTTVSFGGPLARQEGPNMMTGVGGPDPTHPILSGGGTHRRPQRMPPPPLRRRPGGPSGSFLSAPPRASATSSGVVMANGSCW